MHIFFMHMTLRVNCHVKITAREPRLEMISEVKKCIRDMNCLISIKNTYNREIIICQYIVD